MGRRTVRLAALPAVLVLAACGGQTSAGPSPTVTSSTAATPTPAAGACSGQPTPGQTEGPYFKAGSPTRSALVEASMPGTRLALTGRVLTRDCVPIAGA